MNLLSGLASLSKFQGYLADVNATPAFRALVAFIDHELLEAKPANMRGVLEGFKAAGVATEFGFQVLDEWPTEAPESLKPIGIEDRLDYAALRLRFFSGERFASTDWELVLAIVKNKAGRVAASPPAAPRP